MRKEKLRKFIIRSSAVITVVMAVALTSLAQQKKMVVHIAKLSIDPVQLDKYNAALKEHAETAVRVEPGVLTLYAVYDEKAPAEVTVFEIYADSAAYQAHLKSPHFLKYKALTKNMVKSLQLIPVKPIALESRFHTQQ